ncbi:arylamine N-acetyltransferase [Paenibacillus ginsengarvi]|uniref:Arylamine N-acetyltransferase n=1 Tax=Paenibacillus ginsengarvi TaxID=400777 RepID=A0A3B0CBL2_9BACL|nr:arylamine N-acetyltransferase [Paenibacillus ginsengarvi]RKN82008.1 hypothetical protein D7M11_18715 [Paenibacillus ginsengarvi]
MLTATLRNRYLDHLQTLEQPPSLDYLRKLIKLHLGRFPFENLSKFHYYTHKGQKGLEWLPDMELFLDNCVSRGMGGNCYILNSHFGALLESLGFQVELVRATGGNTHLALRVTIDKQMYYVDVGYGAPLLEPLVLEEQPRFSRLGEEIEITRLGPGRFIIDRRAGGQSFVTKTIEWEPVRLDDFEEVITDSLRDRDDNPFMRRIVVTLLQEDRAYSVMNNKLFVKTNERTEVHEYTKQSDWIAMMKSTYGLDEEALRSSVDFVAERGVKLFDR